MNIEIPAGTSVALMGHSGSGKSTLVLALTGLIPILSGAALILHSRVQRVACVCVRACVHARADEQMVHIQLIRQAAGRGATGNIVGGPAHPSAVAAALGAACIS